VSDPYWFHKKWGLNPEVPMDDVYNRISDLEIKVKELEEKYLGSLEDIKRLEEENIETTNTLYRLENSLDARIDILAEHCRINYDV
jgi:peptidoglycan hydrolase CwlO-like protein